MYEGLWGTDWHWLPMHEREGCQGCMYTVLAIIACLVFIIHYLLDSGLLSALVFGKLALTLLELGHMTVTLLIRQPIDTACDCSAVFGISQILTAVFTTFIANMATSRVRDRTLEQQSPHLRLFYFFKPKDGVAVASSIISKVWQSCILCCQSLTNDISIFKHWAIKLHQIWPQWGVSDIGWEFYRRDVNVYYFFCCLSLQNKSPHIGEVQLILLTPLIPAS